MFPLCSPDLTGVWDMPQPLSLMGTLAVSGVAAGIHRPGWGMVAQSTAGGRRWPPPTSPGLCRGLCSVLILSSSLLHLPAKDEQDFSSVRNVLFPDSSASCLQNLFFIFSQTCTALTEVKWDTHTTPGVIKYISNMAWWLYVVHICLHVLNYLPVNHTVKQFHLQSNF